MRNVLAIVTEGSQEMAASAIRTIFAQHASMVPLTEKQTEEVAPSTTVGPIRAGGA